MNTAANPLTIASRFTAQQMAWAWIGLYVILSLIWSFVSDATWDDDCPTRTFNALHAFSEPIQFISPWNRPLFILIFALPVQLGFWTVPVIMTAITAGSAWLLFKAVNEQKLPFAPLVVPFYLFQTFPFVISHNALTEPLAMALIAGGYWAMVFRKWNLLGWMGGLLVLARLELILLLPIWGFILLRAKAYLPIVYLAVPFILWNLAGGVLTGDWTYVFTSTVGSSGEENRYGQTPFEHYFLRYIYVTGPIIFFLGLYGLMRRVVQGGISLFVDVQYVVGFLAYVIISHYVTTGNSAGFLRNLIPITPLMAVLALDGFQGYYLTATAGNQFGRVRKDLIIISVWFVVSFLLAAFVFNRGLFMHTLFDPSISYPAHAVFLLLLPVMWVIFNTFFSKERFRPTASDSFLALFVALACVVYTGFAEPPGANDSTERRSIREMGQKIQPLIADGRTLYVNHIWYFWTQKRDPQDSQFKRVNVKELDAAPEGSVVLWELHYSPRLEGDVKHTYFDAHKEWTELLRYRSVQDGFMGMVFQKTKNNYDHAKALSDLYLNKFGENGNALSAAGNVHARWGNFKQAIVYLSKASKLMPDDPDVWFSLGMAYLYEKEIVKAENAFLQTTKADPQFPNGWFQLGSVHAMTGKYDQALLEYNEAIRLKPSFLNAYFARGTVYGQLGRYPEAIGDFSHVLMIESGHVQARFNRGATYARVDAFDSAVKDLEIALKSMPNNSAGWLFLGKSHLALGDTAQACASFQTAATLKSPVGDSLVTHFCK